MVRLLLGLHELMCYVHEVIIARCLVRTHEVTLGILQQTNKVPKNDVAFLPLHRSTAP